MPGRFLFERAVTPPTRLSEIRRDSQHTILGVDGDDVLSRRLADLGFVPGAAIELIYTSLFSWPRAYRLHGYRLALRKEEAQRVMVEARP